MSKQVNERSSILPIEDDTSGVRWRCQHTLALLGFIGVSIVYVMQVNLSIAIVAMVKKNRTGVTEPLNYDNLSCPEPNGSLDGNIAHDGEFDWDESVQGQILSFYFFGYAISNFLGGMITKRFGSRLVMGLGILGCSILTVISPWAARSSSNCLIAVRFLEGLSEGVSLPAMHAILASWVLPDERSTFSGTIYAGVNFGTLMALSLGGTMCNSDFLGGWPSVFYIFGAMGIIWSILWFILIRDSPEEHPRISDSEYRKLLPMIQMQKRGNNVTPWKHIATSKPFWGTAAMQFGYAWGFYTLMAAVPTYFSQIQHMDLTSNGALSGLPFLISWIVTLLFTNLMTKLTEDGRISILNVRRLAMVLAGYGPTLCLICMCFVGCNQTVAVAILCISLGITGTSYAGYMCSHIDLSPQFAGTLFGLTNSLASIPGFISPIITGFITKNNETITAWNTVFLITAAIYAISTTFYLVVITADVQNWNFVDSDLSEQKKKEQDGEL